MFAGLIRAKELGLISENESAVLDSTAHQLKFIGFQDMYYQNDFPAEYEVTPDSTRANKPELVIEGSEKEKNVRSRLYFKGSRKCCFHARFGEKISGKEGTRRPDAFAQGF